MNQSFDGPTLDGTRIGTPFGTRVAARIAIERTPRASTRRQNLYAATMLVPLVATVALAAGKLVLQRADIGGLVQTAQAQQTPPRAARTAAPVQPAAAAPTPGTATPPVSAAPAAAASTGAGSAAVAVLLEQANYWRNQQQYDQAVESLKRALALEPRNADALALTGLIEADRGNRAVAENALTRLRGTAPGDPRIDKIDQALRLGSIPQEALTDARRLARDGRQAEAVDRYNRVFRGNAPPDRLSVEYYQTLAGTEGGWEQARDGLARVVRQNPQDLRAQLAYAQILTYREGARADGIARLAALSKNPAVSEQANTAWRQALGWLPDNKGAVDPITVYLNAHPNDAQLANKLEAARSPAIDAADPTAADRIGGFEALNKNRLGDASRLFQKSLDANPNDADAIGGLGLVKLRQRNFAEAKVLLGRAIAIDPEHRGRWQPALNGANQATSAAAAGGGGGGGNASAQAQALLNRGDFPAAEAELKRQIARNVDNSGGLQSMLADAQAQQGKLGDAEASYRDAMARNPRNAGAVVGLAGVLSREGRSEEAQQLLVQAQGLGAGPQIGQARALVLRQQAQEVRDPATQVGLYREALASDPTNPWLRLDLAKALVAIGQVNQARSVMADAVSGARPSTDAIKAGIIFANVTSDPDAASALIEKLPPSARTPDMRVLQAQAGLQREIGSALVLSRPMAKQRLLEMAQQPDPDGARGAAIAKALYRIGEKTAARDAILTARGSSRPTPSAQLAYAGAFLDIGATQDAEQTLARLGSGRGLSAQERKDLSQLQAGLAVRSSDQLNQKGKQADAYDVLAPALATTPDNPALNMALARLYEGAKNPKEALEINEALLRRDPDNQDARRAAIDAALAAGNRTRADELVQEGLRMHPNDPKAWIASAELAKARGNTARALRDYQHARDLRLQQLGYSDNGGDSSTLPPGGLAGVSLLPGAPATYAPVTPRSQLNAPGRRQTPNRDGGADESTIPPVAAPAAEVPPSSAPPNLYPDGATAPAARAPFTPGAISSRGVAPNYVIPHGRMLDTTASDLPRPGGGVVPVSAQSTIAPTAAPTPLSAPPPAVVAAAPVTPVPTAPAPADPPPAAPLATTTVAIAPSSVTAPPAAPQPVVQAAAPPPPPVFAETPRYQPNPPPAAVFPSGAYPASAAPIASTPQPQFRTVQYQPSPAPQYQAPQYQAPQYQAPQYQAPQYAQPAGAGGYRNTYQPTVPPDAAYQPQLRGYLPQYQPSTQQPPITSPPRITSPASSGSTGPFGRTPSVLSDSGNAPGGYYNNPFRKAAPAAPGQSDSDTGGSPAVGRPDAVTEEIDRNIISLRDEVAPSLQGNVGFRNRSGDSGLDKLSEFTVPLEAEFSPGGTGRVKLTVTPTQLTSGTISGDLTNLGRFGSSALSLVPGTSATNFLAGYKGAAPGDQSAQGAGIDASYVFRNFKADVGTSPVGFKIQNVIGGVEYAPKLRDNLTFRLLLERRAITDSLLSYGGTVDTRSGIKWGGETRDHVRGNFEFSSGLADFYIGGGAANVRGTHVASNSEFEFGAGGSYPVYRATGQELRVGLDLVYFGYNKNLRFFTLGQGGYFSPQSYAAALIPVIWRETVDEDLSYEVGASFGFQSYHEKQSPYYPLDSALQAQLVAQQSNTLTAIPGLQTSYPTQSKSGFAGTGHATIDYRVAPNLHVGGKLNFQHSGNFDEASGLVYARYLFNGTTSQ